MVRRLGADEGAVVKVGQLICDIETPSEAEEQDIEPSDMEPESASEVAPTSTRTVSEPSAEQDIHSSSPKEMFQTLQASLFAPRDSTLDTASSGAQFSGEAAMLPSAPPPLPSSNEGSGPHSSGSVPERQQRQSWTELKKIVKASPAVRTLAARMDVDLGEVRGTGDGGRVTADDVRSHNGHLDPVNSTGGETGVVNRTSRDEVAKSTRVDFGRTRKVMYRAMGDMGQVPHFG